MNDNDHPEAFLEQEMELLDLQRSPGSLLSAKHAYQRARECLEACGMPGSPPTAAPGLEQYDSDGFMRGLYYLYIAAHNGRREASRELDGYLMSAASICIEPLLGECIFPELRPRPAGSARSEPAEIYETLYQAVQESNSDLSDPLLISQDSIICFPHFLYYYHEYARNVLGAELPPLYDLSECGCASGGTDHLCVLDFLMTSLHLRLESMAGDEQHALQPLLGMPADSAFLVAISYYHGINLHRDTEAALTWLFYAAVTGSVKAHLFIAVNFANFSSLYSRSRCSILYLLGNAHNLIAGRSSVSSHECLMGVGANLCPTIDCPDGSKELFNEVIYNFLVTMRANIIYFNDNFYDTDVHDPSLILKTQDMVLDAINIYAEHRDEDIGAALASFFIFSDPLACIIVKEITENFQALKLVRNASAEHCFRFLIRNALKHSHPLALETYCNYLLIHHQVRKSAIRYFDRLMELGFARECFELAGFFYEGHNDIEQDPDKLNHYMKKAADLGYGMAQFNLSLETDDELRERSIFYAFKSLQRNIVVAYYSLYEVLKGEARTRELAHTCLRLASEYGYMPAVNTLTELRQRGEYRPFAYMREIEKIEQLSDTSVSACIVMFLIYSESHILPENRFKANYFLHKACLQGSQVPFALYYLQEKKRNTLYNGNVNVVLPSFGRGSQCMSEFFNASGIDSIHFDDDLAGPLTSLIQNLIRNDHFLAYNALVASFDNGFWNNMLNRSARAKVQEIIEQKRALWPDFRAMYRSLFPDEQFGHKGLGECREDYSRHLATLHQTTQDNSTIYLIKARICLRPLAAAPDRRKARGYFARSLNSGSFSAIALAFMSYAVIDDYVTLTADAGDGGDAADMFVESLVEQ